MYRKVVLVSIALILFFIPNVFWGTLYIVGGDDARLYYLFPKEYLENYSFKLIGNNALGSNFGYLPVSYSVPVILIIWLLKIILPLLHTQFFLYGVILSGGFVFFYAFVRELISQKGAFYFWSAIVASLFYIFSNYITHTFFQHQQLSIFLIMMFPGCLYLFVMGVNQQRARWILASSFLYSIFSSTVLSLPWFLPALFTLSPFLIFFLWRHRQYSWKALAIFVVAIVLTNMYWIIHYLIPIFSKTSGPSVVGNLTSQAFVQENHNLIESLAGLNSSVSQMSNAFRTGWSQREGIHLLQSLGVLYLFVILLGGLLLAKAKKETRTLYIVSIAGLIIAMLFITPNFGPWNLQLFQFFNDHVPLFGMFRTMNDKFSLAMAFNYAFALFVSLIVLGEARIKARYLSSLIIAVAVLTIYNALPYIFPVYKDDAYSTRISGRMNQDFYDLANYVRSLNTTSRFLWLPMTFPGYTYIGDAYNANHFYAGLSPLQLFSGKSDLVGFYGLSTPVDPGLNWKLLALLQEGAYEEVAKIFAKQNIGYIIVNHDILPTKGLASFEGFDFMKSQNDAYRKVIVGKKIKDFGSRYSLYALNEEFALPTIFLTHRLGEVPTVDKEVTFHKLADGQYEVLLEKRTQVMTLILLEPYSQFWTISSGGKPTLAYMYGNAWDIPPGPQEKLVIRFWPITLR